MTEAARHSVSVSAVIVGEDDRVLLVRRRDNGRWEPPGGVLELDETIEAGLRREVREETGLEVEVERLTGVYKNMSLGVVALVFRCSPAGGALQTGLETAELQWTDPATVEGLMAPAFAVRVLDAFAAQADGPAYRDHDGYNLIDIATVRETDAHG